MTNDDLFESESYFNRKYDSDKAEARERLKAKRELQEQAKAAPPIDRQQMLQSIIGDSTEPYSVRMDARHLLEVADLRPRDFQREYDDFLAWRSENSK